MLARGLYGDALRVVSRYSASGSSDGTVEMLSIEAPALAREQQGPLADKLLSQADSICQGANFLACGDAITARGIVDTRQGKLSDARQSFSRALQFAQASGDQWLKVGASVNLGYIALQTDHYDEAVDWSRSAYQIAIKLGYENLAQVASGNLGWAYYQLGDDQRALDQFLVSQEVAARIGNIHNELQWLTTAGYVYRDSGDWQRAAASYRQALNLARQINSREDVVNALEDLAEISIVAGKLDEADAHIHQVTPIETAGGASPSANLVLTMGKLASARSQFTQAEAYFRSVLDNSSTLMTFKLGAGFELAKLFEAQNNLAAAEREYKATLATYETARAQLKSEESQLPFGTNAAQIYDHYIHLLVQQGKSGEALAVADASRAQALEQSLGVSKAGKSIRSIALDPQRIAQKTGAVLLFYWLGEKQSYLWAITRSKTTLFILPAGSEITEHIRRYQKALLDVRDPLKSENADGQALYQELVAPAAAMVRPGDSAIIFADGVLSELNFETLIVPSAGSNAQARTQASTASHYLLDDLTLSSAPSLAMLAAAEPMSGAGQRILLLGNPISPNQDFPTLPMFGYEMTKIESHFAPAQVSAFTGQQATPTAYVASDPRSYAYIHFVSHAVASQTNPLDSAIILSNSNGQEDSYKLYAREIIEHPIDARLVTISACYGSGTRAYAGEGLVGLSWAFLRAGAQRVIGALWEVSDDSTPRLMDSLYQGLTAGDSPAVALRNAKL
ncbi:MAG: CHAT domain-containing protein, partial [Terracidiphilus sp.]